MHVAGENFSDIEHLRRQVRFELIERLSWMTHRGDTPLLRGEDFVAQRCR